MLFLLTFQCVHEWLKKDEKMRSGRMGERFSEKGKEGKGRRLPGQLYADGLVL